MMIIYHIKNEWYWGREHDFVFERREWHGPEYKSAGKRGECLRRRRQQQRRPVAIHALSTRHQGQFEERGFRGRFWLCDRCVGGGGSGHQCLLTVVAGQEEELLHISPAIEG